MSLTFCQFFNVHILEKKEVNYVHIKINYIKTKQERVKDKISILRWRLCKCAVKKSRRNIDSIRFGKENKKVFSSKRLPLYAISMLHSFMQHFSISHSSSVVEHWNSGAWGSGFESSSAYWLLQRQAITYSAQLFASEKLLSQWKIRSKIVWKKCNKNHWILSFF